MISILSKSAARSIIGFVALLCILVGGTWVVVQITTRYLLYQNATGAARSWAQYLASNVADLEQIAAGEKPSLASMAFFHQSQKSDQVFRYEIYDRNGFSLLISDHDEVTLASVSDFSTEAALVAKTAQPIVETRDGTGLDQPPFFARAVMPVTSNGRVVAVVAAYVDQTAQRDSFYDTFLRAAAALCLLTSLSFAIPAIAWYRRSKEKHQAEEKLVAAQAVAEVAAREARKAHATLLEAFRIVPEGLALFDAQDRLVLWNTRYAELYGENADEVVAGRRFEDLVRAGLARRQYPDAKGCEEAWLAERLARHRQPQHTHEQRLPYGRWLRIHERRTADGGSIGVRIDITELKRREQALQAQNLRFDTALNNMSQGLCMFDHEQRLVVCNGQFAQIYGLPVRLTAPGATLQEILAHRIASGLYAADAESGQAQEVFSAAAQNVPTARITELNDGRSILIKHRPMPGGGYVATHEDITEQRNIEARIRHMAHYDALTDLANRSLLRERLERVLECPEQAGPVAILWLDLDRFKEVNDTLGHATGDALLKAVARRLIDTVRAEDTVARLGGDEFAVLQRGVSQPVGATSLASRLIKSVGAPYQINDHQIVIGTSVGISIAPSDAADPEQLLKNADLALYRVKKEGRGTYRFFEPEMDARMHARRKMERDLRNAMASAGFELFYQPIVDIESNRITAFEALLRWNHPERGRISPTEFIPLTEETGLIASIGEWALRAACAQAATWPRGIKVAVNLSPLQFKQSDLVQVTTDALGSSGLSASELELEITESALLENTEKTLATLHALRGLGVRISMDDFGTGYSSLSNLRSFPFDKIKVDQSFTQGLGKEEQCETIIQAVVALGHGLGMTTTAEGVETADQLAWVRAIGIDEVQGFHLGRPVPASEIGVMRRKFNDTADVAA